jgi:hypothetical protein
MTPKILLPAMRQYRHNDGNGMTHGFDYNETCKIVAVLEAKLRELAEACLVLERLGVKRMRFDVDHSSMWAATQWFSSLFNEMRAALKAAKESTDATP